MYVEEYFNLRHETADELLDMKPNFGYDGFGELTFYRTYSRIKEDGKNESWGDVVLRVIEGVMSIRKDWYIKNRIVWREPQWQEYAAAMAYQMFNMTWLPAGRGLWAMGTPFVYQHGSMSLYNCAFTQLHSDERLADDFGWLMDVLMLGVGVGFEPTTDHIKLFPTKGSFIYDIPDSREGWVNSVVLKILSRLVPNSKAVHYRTHLIRKRGLPIKGFGGMASGPEPLIKLLAEIDQLLDLYETGKISAFRFKTDVANLIGCCVVAGNVRRSAQIALGNINNEEFLDLKDYTKNPERAPFAWMSNNSGKFIEKRDYNKLGEIAERVKTSGDPGGYNMRNVKYGRIGKFDDVPEDKAIGLNPCIRKTTKLLTSKGIRNLEDVNIGDYIWSETGWTKVIKKWSTGVNDVYRYGTTAGVFYGTDNHRVVQNLYKIEIKDAQSVDILRGEYLETKPDQLQAIVDGLVIGDGTQLTSGQIVLCIGEKDSDYFNSEIKDYIGQSVDRDYIYKIDTTIEKLSKTYEREIPVKYIQANRKTVCSFLRGIFSANGYMDVGRICLGLTSSVMIEQIQMLLSSVGLKSYWNTHKEKRIAHQNGTYWSKKSYRLTVVDKVKFQESIGFIQMYKNETLKTNIKTHFKKDKQSHDIVSVEYLGKEETFDITVDNYTHTYWSQCLNVSNCGEIPLENREVCNLVCTLPTRCKDEEQWFQAVEFATFYASTVSLLPTHQPSTNAVVNRNRRIGVDIIDYTGWKHERGLHNVIDAMRKGYNLVRAANSKYNAEAGVPASIRVTTVKPGGTVPKIAGRTPGIGHPTFKHTLRRIRIAIESPIVPLLIAANVPNHPDFYDKKTLIFEYPIIQGPSRPAGDVSLWEQAVNLMVLQSEWADNAVSNTLYFRPKWNLTHVINIEGLPKDMFGENEIRIIENLENGKQYIGDNLKVIKNNWNLNIYQFDPNHEEDIIEYVLASFIGRWKSFSLLPHSPKGAYVDMPEEGITEEEYQLLKKNIKPIDWSQLCGSDGEDEKFCQGASCELDLNR